MCDYRSAKIELMALIWSVYEKFKDYFLESKFTVFTDKNHLVCVKTSTLGTSHIHWLSKLVWYLFDIVYRTGYSSQINDVLSCKPQNNSDNVDDKWQAICYTLLYASN